VSFLRPTLIYHITHVENLASIASSGGINSCRLLRSSDANYTDVAHQSIQDRRNVVVVPCAQGGTLHDYVPFYFAPRSPMLYTISRGNVASCPDQTAILHLVTSVQLVAESGRPFAFTDGHGIMVLTEFFDDLTMLPRIDWPLMEARYWFDTAEDSDRKRRRQAEFLVHERCPWDIIQEIGVQNRSMESRVHAIVELLEHKPEVNVRPGWYY